MIFYTPLFIMDSFIINCINIYIYVFYEDVFNFKLFLLFIQLMI